MSTETITLGPSAGAAGRRAGAGLAGRVLATDADVAVMVLRLALAVVILPHGGQHLFGWFGGGGFAGTHAWMTGALGIPSPLAALAIVVEFVAPVALLLGLGGRIAALGIAGLMLVAATTHLEHGFFMNWNAQLAAGAEGFEFHILAIAMAVAVAIRGSGALSLDRRIAAARAVRG